MLWKEHGVARATQKNKQEKTIPKAAIVEAQAPTFWLKKQPVYRKRKEKIPSQKNCKGD